MGKNGEKMGKILRKKNDRKNEENLKKNFLKKIHQFIAS